MILDRKMFTNQSFTENKAVINREICCFISDPRFNISKNLSVTRCNIWCRLLNSFQNFENHNSQSKKWILVMLSWIVTCCKISDFNPIQAEVFWNHIGSGGHTKILCFSLTCGPITTKLGMMVLWNSGYIVPPSPLPPAWIGLILGPL